jgi:hypothetical protein
MGKVISVFVVLLSLGAAAQAQTVQNVLGRAGLLGRWANDCGRLPAGDNTHTIYAIDGAGQATLTYDQGPKYRPTVYTIPSARRVAPGRILYDHINQATGQSLTVVLTVTPTQIRVWSSRRSTGEVLVANGKFVSNGRDSPLQTRCN